MEQPRRSLEGTGLDESVLIEFSQHSDMLARAIYELASRRGGSCILNACDWYFAAGSVVKVESVTALHDFTIDWCGSAADFEDRKSKLWTEHLTELSRFTFCWTGFECLSKGLLSKAELRRGLMPALRSRFNSCYLPGLSKSHLLQQINAQSKRLVSCLECLQNPAGLHLKVLDILHTASSPVLGGIDAIKSLRNDFAHGGFSLPLPDDQVDLNDEATTVIAISNGLLLLVSQYLLFVSATANERTLEVYLPYGDTSFLPLSAVLLSGGSLRFDFDADWQLELF